MGGRRLRAASRGAGPRVLVCGGGPTGLLAGLLLARAAGGSSVRVVDAAAGPSPLTKALVLQVRTVEVLASLGLLEEALRRGRVFEGVTLHSAGNDVPVTLSGVDSPRPHALIIPQPEIEDILRGALLAEGVRVEWNCRLQEFSEEGDSKVIVSLQHSRVGGKLDRLETRLEKASVEFLLGCDGAHSSVRHGLGVPFEGGRYENEFILTDCRCRFGKGADVRGLERGIHFVLEGSRGVLLMFPLVEEGRYRFVCTRGVHAVGGGADGQRQGGQPEPAKLTEFENMAREAFGAEFKLSDPSWLTTYKLHSRLAQRYCSPGGRVFIAGDAAHIHSPVGGLGMNTGLQDSYNLAWKLALVLRGVAPRSLLTTYEQERRPVGDFLVSRTDRGFRTMAGGGALFRTARWLLLNPLFGRNLLLPVLIHRMPTVISQVGISYRDGPLAWRRTLGWSLPWWNSARVRAGDRAPDVAGLQWAGAPGATPSSPLGGRGSPGRRTSLHEILSPSSSLSTFTLFLLGWGPAAEGSSASCWVEALRVLIDSPIHTPGACPLAVLAVNAPVDTRSSEGGSNGELCVEHLSDDTDAFRRRYGLLTGPAMVLVRPDFHVAFLTDGPDPLAPASDFLRRLGAC